MEITRGWARASSKVNKIQNGLNSNNAIQQNPTELDPGIIIQQAKGTEASAIESVAATSNVAAIIISPNFADCLIKRITKSGNVAPEVLYNSTIHVMPDMVSISADKF